MRLVKTSAWTFLGLFFQGRCHAVIYDSTIAAGRGLARNSPRLKDFSDKINTTVTLCWREQAWPMCLNKSGGYIYLFRLKPRRVFRFYPPRLEVMQARSPSSLRLAIDTCRDELLRMARASLYSPFQHV
ncbi:hypothetical protein RRG08_041120 [Elysia crispata]|uniref:Secreted protein n=1 Tax=Elysia crispata TaxID=231223 RepID=A0AAE1CP98_9GAST|nr:hypothetical protein RRG08_041120 [Elysia crispata]